MRKIPKDFQRIVDSDLKISRQPESTDSERISFDLRFFLPPYGPDRLSSKNSYETVSPNRAQLRRSENRRRFDQVCVNVQVSSTPVRGHLSACRQRKRELRTAYFKLDDGGKPARAVAFLYRVPTFPRSAFGSWFYDDAPRVFERYFRICVDARSSENGVMM